ncbi:MAG TPA: hypothetical protein VHB77_10385, partial [Planctomycetaceae bacterium]|nr:hypothetical protein [Planctomycetaceae bacterium]
GNDRLLARESLVSEVLEWHKNAPRDATRNFLAGVIVHFHDGAPAARPYFVATEQSVGARRWLTAFLPPDTTTAPVVRGPAQSQPQAIPRRQPVIPAAGDNEAPRPAELELGEPEELPEVTAPRVSSKPAKPPEPLPPPSAVPKRAPQPSGPQSGPSIPNGPTLVDPSGDN